MIARLDNLREHSVVFKHLTGLAAAVFDELAAQVVPAVEAAHRGGRSGRPRTGVTTGRSVAAGSWSSTGSAG